MGVWSFLTGAPRAAYAPNSQPVLASPLSSSDSLEQAIVTDFFGELPSEVVTVEVASRVPEIKKALVAHQSLVSPLRFEKYVGGQRAEFQPYWVSSCGYKGVSRLINMKLLVAELFWHGQAVLGARLDTEGNVYDWVTIPRKLWTLNPETSEIEIDPSIPAEFRMRAIYVPFGENGVMADGIDSIRQARKLELARQARLDSPPAATELHITDPNRDEMSSKEKEKLARDYSKNRAKYAVAVTPSYLDVKERGTSGQLDLFESAKNSLRLELAMHGGVPASYVEGGKEGGAGGQMTYQNVNGEPSEIWTFGSARFAQAIAAALSGGDVVGPNAEVRFDASVFAIPAPLTFDPEAGDVGSDSGLGSITATEEAQP